MRRKWYEKKGSDSIVGCVYVNADNYTACKRSGEGFFDNSIILFVDIPVCVVNGQVQEVGDVAPHYSK